VGAHRLSDPRAIHQHGRHSSCSQTTKPILDDEGLDDEGQYKGVKKIFDLTVRDHQDQAVRQAVRANQKRLGPIGGTQLFYIIGNGDGWRWLGIESAKWTDHRSAISRPRCFLFGTSGYDNRTCFGNVDVKVCREAAKSFRIVSSVCYL
jgi:small subunit ribosomal protein S5